MSTRGMIATVRGDALAGVYQHYDSYIEGLGESLLARYQALDGDVVAMRKEAIDDHPGGWATYLERCFCHDPERDDDGVMTFECFCGSGDYSHCDPLSIEYVYVLNSSGLGVYIHAPTGGSVTNTCESEGFQWQSPEYRHVYVGELPWDADDDALLAFLDDEERVRDAAYAEVGR